MKKIFTHIFLIILGLLAPIFLFEIGIRVEHFIRKGTAPFENPSSRWDSNLGWLGKEHLLGNISKSPVLVIGDSFTEGLGIPSEKMWFAALDKVYPDKGVIAYGGLGYGTLQELIVLRKYLAKDIKPALIVIQLCSNDIINNYYPLELNSYLQRAPGPRPYFEQGQVKIRLPRMYESIIWPLISISRVAYKYNNKWDSKLAELARERKIESVEFSIQENGFKHPLFRQAVSVTDRLVHDLIESVAGTKIVFMLIDDLEPYTAALKGITRKYKVPMVVPVHEHYLPDAARLPDGAHLNEMGNEFIGDIFIESAKNRGLF